MQRVKKVLVTSIILLLISSSTLYANQSVGTKATTILSNTEVSSNNSNNTPTNFDLSQLLQNENFSMPSTVPLIKKSSKEKLDIISLNNGNVGTNSIYTNFNRYLLNFSYVRIYTLSANQQRLSGMVQYNNTETITLTLFAFFPVILEIYQNSSTTTDNMALITTKAYVDPEYQAKIGFSVEFNLDYYFGAKLSLFNPSIGPGSFSFTFEKSWEFDTPLDGTLIGEKRSIASLLIPPSSPLIKLGLAVQPKIDTDFSASLNTSDSTLSLSTKGVEWQHNGSIQSFSVNIPEFYTQNSLLIDLFNFDMEFTLSLQFFLSFNVLAIPILSKKIFYFPIFAIPIETIHLPLEEGSHIPLTMDVTPSNKIPVVYGVDYSFDDSAGDGDGLIEPGETIDLQLLITNLGDGSALNVNTTVSSDNVTIYGEDSVPLLLKNRGNFALQSGFYFIVPSNYYDDFIIATATFTYLAVNGSLYTSSYDIYLRVVDPTDTYLEVSNLILDYPGNYWKAGDNINIYFNVTNRGAKDINFANIALDAGFDTDINNPVSIVSDVTNSTSLSKGESAILGPIILSSAPEHDDGLVYLYFDVYYEDADYGYFDPFDTTLAIYIPRPTLNLVSSVGIDENFNGIFEAGENVWLQFTIQNVGEGTGYNINGYITSDNPDLNITDSEIFVGNLDPGTDGTSTFATINIPITARNQTALFTLHLKAEDSKGHVLKWEYNITIDIVEQPSPIVSLLYYSIDDSLYGDGDGIPEPGETFLLYVYTRVNNTGFNVIATANNTDLIFYNNTCSYGDLSDEESAGEGYWVYVPLSYKGGETYIYINATAESYSGRKTFDTGYIVLDIPKGDLTPPEISLEEQVPSEVYVGEHLSINFSLSDPQVTGELQSGVAAIILLYTFENSEIQIVELQGAEGIYSAIFDTSNPGTYYFIIAAVDNAGNIAFIPQSDDPYSVTVIQKTTETTTPTPTSTTTPIETNETNGSTTQKSSYMGLIPIITLMTILSIPIIRHRRMKKEDP